MPDDNANVTSILDAPTSSPLALIVRRRQWIMARQQEIRGAQQSLTEEYNALWHEDRSLAQAESAVRKLIQS
jgi:hypothetical protein